VEVDTEYSISYILLYFVKITGQKCPIIPPQTPEGASTHRRSG